MEKRILAAALSCFAFASAAIADPLHSRADGGYWHHDSGWVFPAKLADYERVGIPQDIAGSRDAVAYYARVVDGQRIVVSVDVFPADSAADASTLESAKAALLLANSANEGDAAEATLPLGEYTGLRATQVTLTRGAAGNLPRELYFVTRGEWRVRIVFTAAAAGAAPVPGGLEFVRAQRWDALPAS